MRTRSSLVILSILIGVATACGSSTGAAVVRSDSTVATVAPPPGTDVPSTDPPQPSEPVPAAILTTRWLLDSRVTVGGLQPFPSGTGAGITIGADGTMELDTGCNTGSGQVSFQGEYSMTVGPLQLTEMGCADDIYTIEAGMLAILAEPLTWSVDGDVLALIPTTISDTGLHFNASA